MELTEMAKELLKRELLEKYADREPTAYYQFDAFTDTGGGGPMEPDGDGDERYASVTYELMNGANVRVLIRAGTDEKQALRALKKIRQWVKKDGFAYGRDGIARETAHWNEVFVCPRCGVRTTGGHDEMCQYPDGTPTELSDDEVQRVIQVQKNGLLLHTADDEIAF